MIVHRAEWLLPIARPPVSGGWVALDRERIVAVGGPDERPPLAPVASPPFASSAILPGLVNAHTHLELSWMAGQVPPASSMPAWVARLMALRRTVSHDAPAPIESGIASLEACGTALVGEVTNTLAAYDALVGSKLSACVFRELLGFDLHDPGAMVSSALDVLGALDATSRVRPSIVPHAPYSVAPALLEAIARVSSRTVVSVHVGESAEEMQFLRDGTGAWRRLLQDLGAWSAGWQPPGSGPVEYLGRFGLINERLLAVHCVHLTDDELRRLAEARATVVTCPRSNRWTGAGTPPIERFYRAGVRVAIGTDSLASVEDLNLFHELSAVRAAAPSVPARTILDSATRGGASALGFGDELGTIEAGKRARLIAVRLPDGLLEPDVEEYLLTGIDAVDVHWLDAQQHSGAPKPNGG